MISGCRTPGEWSIRVWRFLGGMPLILLSFEFWSPYRRWMPLTLVTTDWAMGGIGGRMEKNNKNVGGGIRPGGKSTTVNHKAFSIDSCSAPTFMCMVYVFNPIHVYIYEASTCLCYDTARLYPSYTIIQINAEPAIDRH